tara:strand:+ start:131 stop:310 length:180 start_codon:yes stop_codon:yes gene_type:complete
MKLYLVSIFFLFLLASCSSVKEELPVAGELICTAAGVDGEECVKAAKIDNEEENNNEKN